MYFPSLLTLYLNLIENEPLKSASHTTSTNKAQSQAPCHEISPSPHAISTLDISLPVFSSAQPPQAADLLLGSDGSHPSGPPDCRNPECCLYLKQVLAFGWFPKAFFSAVSTVMFHIFLWDSAFTASTSRSFPHRQLLKNPT